MAHIQKKKAADGSPRYEVRWIGPTTKRHRQQTFRAWRNADDFVKLHNADQVHGDVRDYDAGDRPLSHYAEKWLARVAILDGGVKPRTLYGYKSMVTKYINPAFGSHRVSSITVSDVNDWRDEFVKNHPKNPAGVKYPLGTLRRILDMAVEDRAIRFNPADTTTRTKRRKAPFKGKFLTAAQVTALAAELTAPYDFMVTLLAWTGLRSGELAALNVGDVHLSAATEAHPTWSGYLDVTKTGYRDRGEWVTGAPKSESSTRRVDLQDWLAEDLHAYLTRTHPTPAPDAPLFPGRYCGGYTHGANRRHPDAHRHGEVNWDVRVDPASFYRNVFKPALVRAKLDPRTRLHDLRHSYASLALQRGASPYWLSEQLGHSSYRITLDVYAHWIPSDEAHPLNGRPAGLVPSLRAVR